MPWFFLLKKKKKLLDRIKFFETFNSSKVFEVLKERRLSRIDKNNGHNDQSRCKYKYWEISKDDERQRKVFFWFIWGLFDVPLCLWGCFLCFLVCQWSPSAQKLQLNFPFDCFSPVCCQLLSFAFPRHYSVNWSRPE